jgi:hypothetical protein
MGCQRICPLFRPVDVVEATANRAAVGVELLHDLLVEVAERGHVSLLA